MMAAIPPDTRAVVDGRSPLPSREFSPRRPRRTLTAVLLIAGGALVTAAGGVLAFDLAAFLAVPLFLTMPEVTLPFIDPVVSPWLAAGGLALWAAAGAVAIVHAWRAKALGGDVSPRGSVDSSARPMAETRSQATTVTTAPPGREAIVIRPGTPAGARPS